MKHITPIITNLLHLLTAFKELKRRHFEYFALLRHTLLLLLLISTYLLTADEGKPKGENPENGSHNLQNRIINK